MNYPKHSIFQYWVVMTRQTRCCLVTLSCYIKMINFEMFDFSFNHAIWPRCYVPLGGGGIYNR